MGWCFELNHVPAPNTGFEIISNSTNKEFFRNKDITHIWNIFLLTKNPFQKSIRIFFADKKQFNIRKYAPSYIYQSHEFKNSPSDFGSSLIPSFCIVISLYRSKCLWNATVKRLLACRESLWYVPKGPAPINPKRHLLASNGACAWSPPISCSNMAVTWDHWVPQATTSSDTAKTRPRLESTFSPLHHCLSICLSIAVSRQRCLGTRPKWKKIYTILCESCFEWSGSAPRKQNWKVKGIWSVH